MKKLFMVALIAISTFTTAFASDSKFVNRNVQQSFKEQFFGASDVKWSVEANLAKASFLIDGSLMEAYYELDGAFVGTSTNVNSEKLPVTVKRALAKKFAGYAVKEAVRFDADNETAYFLAADDGNESVVIKVVNGFASIVKRPTR